MTSRTSRTRQSRVDVVIDAPVADVWQLLTDWPRQSDWMLATTVEVCEPGGAADDGQGVGLSLTAVTGFGPLSVTDQMVVTKWDPPHRVDVNHIGKIVRGSATFEVFALPEARSRVCWTEYVDLPQGVLSLVGVAAWPIAKVGFEWGARRSLESLRGIIEGAHPFTG